MLLEVSGICQNCATEVSVLVNNGEVLGRCPACNELPMLMRKIAGVVYIVSNPNQVGVKIGMTEKPIEQRLKTLNSTGVPGQFEVIAVFPSDRPRADEKRVHEKVQRNNIAKEHFNLDPIEAALKAHRALNRREPIFFRDDLRETFELRREEERIKMKLRIRGKTVS